MRLAALSVDLDEIDCYAAIHGLGNVAPDAARAVYRKALARLADLFRSEGVPATFFVIGRDVDDENAERLRQLRDAGHEIANHSATHPYDLSRLPRARIREEVEGGIEAIERAIGEPPRGFRAPGYTITDEVLDVLAELGVAYDSSVFPCPAYWSAKATAMAAIRLAGRRSQSILDDPRVLLAPADPYRVGAPYWRRGRGVVELPIGVSKGPRLPYIGTSVVLSGRAGAHWLTRAIVGRPLVNLELHGIDLADADLDGLEFLRPHQPDLRRTAAEKAAALRAAIGELRRSGYRFVTLNEAAEAAA